MPWATAMWRSMSTVASRPGFDVVEVVHPEAGVTGVAAHGLRNAFQAGAAEKGLTDRQLMALAGQRTSKEATRYTASTERRAMAKDGVERLGKSRLGSTKLSKNQKDLPKLENSGEKHQKNNGLE